MPGLLSSATPALPLRPPLEQWSLEPVNPEVTGEGRDGNEKVPVGDGAAGERESLLLPAEKEAWEREYERVKTALENSPPAAPFKTAVKTKGKQLNGTFLSMDEFLAFLVAEVKTGQATPKAAEGAVGTF